MYGKGYNPICSFIFPESCTNKTQNPHKTYHYGPEVAYYRMQLIIGLFSRSKAVHWRLKMSNSSGELSIDEKAKGKQNVEPITSFTDENIGKNEVLTSFKSADGKIVNITGDVDEAMKLAVNLNDIKIDEKADKKLLLKIDICLLPLLCLLYAFQFMDKISNSYAAVVSTIGFKNFVAFIMIGLAR